MGQHGGFDTGSDHFALRWTIDHGTTELQNVTGSRFNFKDTKLRDWKEAFSQELSRDSERWEALQMLDSDGTTEELDN